MPVTSHPPPTSPCLWDVLAPTVDPRDPLASINLCSALPAGPVALELAAEPGRLRLLARAWDAPTSAALAAAVHAAFPQARLNPVAPADDPARPAADGCAAALELVLRDPEYFPLRTYAREAAECQGDPLAVLARALQGVGPGERLVLRLTLAPAPAGWARRHRPLLHAARRADEHGAPLSPPDRRSSGGATGSLGFLLLLAALALGLWAWPVVAAVRAGQRPSGALGLVPWATVLGLQPVLLGAAAGLALALLLILPLLLALRWRRRPELPTPALLLAKLDAPGCLARLHVLAWAPDRARADALLRRVTTVLPLYARADGNALAARPARVGDPLAPPALCGRTWRATVLSASELASLWGPVGGLADAGDLVRAGSVRRRPPRHAPDGRPWLADGCPLGTSEQGGVALPVAFPDELLGRVTLLLGKTGAGKSTALHHLLAHAMADPARGALVVDPHGDLARALLGLVPRGRRGDVISLDLADADRPVGLNPLDATVGRPPDRIVADAISGLRRLWPHTWGDRMEQMLRQALITLAERNRDVAPDQQFTLLTVAPLLQDDYFRATVLDRLGPPVSNDGWWRDYYATVWPRLREEMINPVLTKLASFATLTVARHIIGQPRTTLDLGAAVMDGKIVIVNLARGVIGGDLAALLGALLVGDVDLAVERQAALPPDRRRRVLVAIDELQALPAVDYARLVGELRKYGAGFLLATQTLAGLDRLDPALRPLLLGNCEALLAFRTSAGEAALLAPELDELVGVADLTNLERGCAYLKASERGLPAPATWLRVHPPADADPALAAALRAAGRARWGVPAVEAAARVAAARAWVRALAELSLVKTAAATGGQQPAGRAGTATPAGAASTSAATGGHGGGGRRRRPTGASRPLPLPDVGPASDSTLEGDP
ncbi:MAG: type IV secretion system DNA-binding domain-containing protein [Chloroflexi bacterium]|nr:type IV secretion system DNA-binding domain-containing protein [Chloroflexota bacterium]